MLCKKVINLIDVTCTRSNEMTSFVQVNKK